MNRLKIALALGILLILMTGSAGLADAPPLPASVWGTVKAYGLNVSEGTLVSAWIDGVKYVESTTTFAGADSVYTIDVPGDDPETPGIEGGREGDTITFGNKTLNILHVPGHAPGNVAFTWPGHAIVGDTVFAGSIGRTDFENSDHQTLIESIHNKILTLPEDTILHPGHGPDTTVAQEKRLNPFLI